MEVGSDPAPLVRGRLDRPEEQRLAFLLRALEATPEAHRERHLDEPEQHEACEQESREREPDPSPGGLDLAAPLVRLEEKWCPVRGADREIDLVEVAEALARSDFPAR